MVDAPDGHLDHIFRVESYVSARYPEKKISINHPLHVKPFALLTASQHTTNFEVSI